MALTPSQRCRWRCAPASTSHQTLVIGELVNRTQPVPTTFRLGGALDIRRRLPDHRVKDVWVATCSPTAVLGVTTPQSRAWRLRAYLSTARASAQFFLRRRPTRVSSEMRQLCDGCAPKYARCESKIAAFTVLVCSGEQQHVSGQDKAGSPGFRITAG